MIDLLFNVFVVLSFNLTPKLLILWDGSIKFFQHNNFLLIAQIFFDFSEKPKAAGTPNQVQELLNRHNISFQS